MLIYICCVVPCIKVTKKPKSFPGRWRGEGKENKKKRKTEKKKKRALKTLNTKYIPNVSHGTRGKNKIYIYIFYILSFWHRTFWDSLSEAIEQTRADICHSISVCFELDMMPHDSHKIRVDMVCEVAGKNLKEEGGYFKSLHEEQVEMPYKHENRCLCNPR